MLLISKLFNLLAQPLNWVVLLLALGLLAGARRPALARDLSAVALLLLVLLGFQKLPDLLLAQLESVHPELPLDADLRGYAGIIVLGGALESGRASQAHAQPLLNGSAERMTVAVSLWRRNPELRLVFTGGEGEYFGSGPSEAQRAQQFFDSMGVPRKALTLESQSQNTFQNAELTRQLPGIDARQRWLLLTSAWHMPRALPTFQKQGWNVTPFPVDFRTGGSTAWGNYSLRDSPEHWELLLHEVLGILAYRLSGHL